jgi:hypothetical protein
MMVIVFDGVLPLTFCNGEESLFKVSMEVVPKDEKVASIVSLGAVKQRAFGILCDIAADKTPRGFKDYFHPEERGAIMIPSSRTNFFLPRNLVKLTKI